MGTSESPIPQFRADGYLPEGVFLATESDVLFRFGAPTRRRRILALRVKRWLELVRQTGARRFLVDGSFVTAKEEPEDVDAVVLLAPDFQRQVDAGIEPALALEDMPVTRHPEEIFAAEDGDDWNAWIEFFSRTRHANGRRKGLVEIQL
jgi:hypothetical protein